jgi:uncharacterized membrane-anchored protein
MAIRIVAAAIAALAITTASAYAANDAGNDATAREIAAMHWQAGPIEASNSHSKITPRPGFVSVTGVEARRVRELGDAVILPGLEADAIDVGNGDEIIYQYFNEGFVSVGDWADVDADAMLAEIKENGNKSNALRRERGVPELHTTGWIERPSLNRDTNTVSWIIEGAGGDGTKFINAVALKLGRNGLEKITWITDPNSLSASLDGFHAAINSHEFNPGYRYLDHVATDRAATYGVAGLVAGVLGVKLAKAVGVGAFAVLSVLAKKLSFLIVLPFVAVGSFFRRLFRRKPAVTL